MKNNIKVVNLVSLILAVYEVALAKPMIARGENSIVIKAGDIRCKLDNFRLTDDELAEVMEAAGAHLASLGVK